MADNASDKADFLTGVQTITKALEVLGFVPILIGGMALVILGSRRVTQDFDFVIAKPAESYNQILDVFYDQGFQLAAKVNDRAEITSTIDSRKVAKIRLKLDLPASAYFLNPKTGLRIDLLFDFPIPAQELAAEAVAIKVRSSIFRVASDAHLLRLKQIAKRARTKAGDADDIAFLQARQQSRKIK
jgi:hypothetical protein